MRILILGSLFFLLSPAFHAAQAQTIEQSIRRFCIKGRQLNQRGIALAPGTPGAREVMAIANQDRASYALIWRIAKASDIHSCRQLF